MGRRIERRNVRLERLGYGDTCLVRPGRRSGRFIWIREGVPPFEGESVQVEVERGLDGVWRFVRFLSDPSYVPAPEQP